MSGNDDSMFFTELEIRAGVPALYQFDTTSANNDYLNEVEVGGEAITKLLNSELYKANNLYQMKKKKIFVSKISSTNDIDKLSKIFTTELLSIFTDNMVENYSTKENLTLEMTTLAKNKRCLFILITRVLTKDAFIDLTDNLSTKINIFISSLYQKNKEKTAYERVGTVQAFIHETINAHYENDAHLLIQSDVMRVVLSTARLHLYLNDFKTLTVSELLEQYKKSNYHASKEKFENTDTRTDKTKKYIKNWKVRHMKSCFNFISEDFLKIKNYLRIINDLDNIIKSGFGGGVYFSDGSEFTCEQYKKIIINLYVKAVSS